MAGFRGHRRQSTGRRLIMHFDNAGPNILFHYLRVTSQIFSSFEWRYSLSDFADNNMLRFLVVSFRIIATQAFYCAVPLPRHAYHTNYSKFQYILRMHWPRRNVAFQNINDIDYFINYYHSLLKYESFSLDCTHEIPDEGFLSIHQWHT